MNYKFLTTSLLITTFLTGCVTFNTAPKEAWDKKKENIKLLEFAQEDHLKQYLDAKDKTLYLNKLATAKIYLIDDAYLNYKNKLKKHKGLTFGSAATSQMFSTAATLFTPNSTKTLLSAGATSVSGLQGSYDKHMLAEKSIEAILNQMDAQRAIVFKSIRESLNDPNYTLIDLNRHLELYADAGTIEAAMREITNTTASNNIKAQKLVNTSLKYSATSNSELIDNWLTQNGEFDPSKIKILTDWLKNQINTETIQFDEMNDTHISDFLTGDHEELRLKFKSEFKIK